MQQHGLLNKPQRLDAHIPRHIPTHNAPRRIFCDRWLFLVAGLAFRATLPRRDPIHGLLGHRPGACRHRLDHGLRRF